MPLGHQHCDVFLFHFTLLPPPPFFFFFFFHEFLITLGLVRLDLVFLRETVRRSKSSVFVTWQSLFRFSDHFYTSQISMKLAFSPACLQRLHRALVDGLPFDMFVRILLQQTQSQREQWHCHCFLAALSPAGFLRADFFFPEVWITNS